MGRYWLAAVVGFGLAALAALWLGWDWGRLGAAPLAAGTIGAWAALLAMRLKR
jgi:energy-converting hydrogenase Eha subunit B